MTDRQHFIVYCTTPQLTTPNHTTFYSPPLPSPLLSSPPLPCPPHPTTQTHNTSHPVTGVSMDTGSTGAYLSPGSLSSKVGRKPGHRERILAYSTVGYGIIYFIFVIFFSELVFKKISFLFPIFLFLFSPTFFIPVLIFSF